MANDCPLLSSYLLAPRQNSAVSPILDGEFLAKPAGLCLSKGPLTYLLAIGVSRYWLTLHIPGPRRATKG
jgi:hypothetical protein